jgi:hypothetical protein
MSNPLQTIFLGLVARLGFSHTHSRAKAVAGLCDTVMSEGLNARRGGRLVRAMHDLPTEDMALLTAFLPVAGPGLLSTVVAHEIARRAGAVTEWWIQSISNGRLVMAVTTPDDVSQSEADALCPGADSVTVTRPGTGA